MWRTTRDEMWRERGWKIFQALESGAKTVAGYSSVRNVSVSPPAYIDEMPR